MNTLFFICGALAQSHPHGAMYSLRSRVVKVATTSTAAGSKKPAVKRIAKRRHVEVSYESSDSQPAPSQRKMESGPSEPPKWRQQLDNIRKMREKRDAPVDHEGAKALGDSSASSEVSVVCVSRRGLCESRTVVPLSSAGVTDAVQSN